MLLPARPTLRCLREDILPQLEGAARDSAILALEQRGVLMSDVDHPVLSKAQAQFPVAGETDSRRESISSARGHPWWKVKVSSWRGAASEDEGSGQTWVCAAGLRRDFYEDFGDQVGRLGHERFLPTDEDRRLLKRDRANAYIELWSDGLHRTALAALDEACIRSGVSFPVRHPVESHTIAEVEVEVFRMEDGGESAVEVTVSVRRVARPDARLIYRAEELILSALDPQEQHWRTGSPSGGDESVFSQVVTGESLEEFLTRAHVRRAPGSTTAGLHSHYTADPELTRKTIEGEAVEAMCGTWFVPRQDHESLDTCPTCDRAYERLAT